MTPAAKPPGIWKGQVLHAISLAILLAIGWAAWIQLDRPFPAAFWTAVFFPVVHQLYVWLAWRLELNSGFTSKTIGFNGYVALFFLLFGGRFVSLLALAWLDRGSLQLPFPAQTGITALFTAIGMYLYAFLLFWAIAVGFNSSAALLVAAFSHAYIWVHFYATEKPDMEFLYSAD